MFPTCVGIVASAVLLGIDGTAIFTPFMILLFPLLRVSPIPASIAVSVGLVTEFFGFLSGIVGYRKKNLIDFRVGWSLVTVGVPVIVVFSIIAQSVSDLLLKLVFGAMMVSMAIYLIATAKSAVRNPNVEKLPQSVLSISGLHESPKETRITSRSGKEFRYHVCDRRRSILISGIGSALEGMLSVGLGELLMPDLVRRCKIPVAVSAATSVFVMTVVVLAGSVTGFTAIILRQGATVIPWNLLIFTIPAAVIGGQVGARLQGRLSSSKTERLIALLFVIIGAAFLYGSLPNLLSKL